jgi:hypothetical protein
MSDYPIKKSEEAWKLMLSEEAYRVLRKKELNTRILVLTIFISNQEPMYVKDVIRLFLKATLNLKVAVAGLVFQTQ